MSKEGAHRAGFVALVGEPNAGKSTLLNALLGEKVAIVTPRPQTTRNRILGIWTGPDAQIAFLDTPGIHAPPGKKKALNRYMNEVALSALLEVDVVFMMVDAAARAARATPERPQAAITETDRRIVARLREAKKPALLGLNKIDAFPAPLLLPMIDAYRSLYPFEEIFPLSALRGEGVSRLPDLITPYLPESPPLFPPDTLTDQAERLLAAEYIREQVIRHTRQELPYATGVEVLLFDESERESERGPGLVRIEANIVVERDSQKGIVIGKGGQMLKRIGTAARQDLERLLGCRVYLGLHVRVEKDWTKTEKGIRKLGYR